MKRPAALVLALALPLVGSGARAQGLDESLRRLVPFGFSGAVLVLEGDTVLHAAGYGFADREAGVPDTPETVFDVGSLSKGFTAAAVLLMAERDLLSVDDSIGRYLPYVPADKRGITVHQLLTHTSGLPPFHAFGGGDVHGDLLVMTRMGAERAIMGSTLDFPPGEGWIYSNSGYTLLAALVERVADRPFEEVLRTDLFEPAGMTRTGLYFQPLEEGAVLAHGYRGGSDEGSPREWTEHRELWALIGNGGVLSTIDDLARWHRALRDGTVLTERSVERLFTPHAEVREGLHYGYGWYVEDDGPGERVVRHGGANDFGFAARWRWRPEEERLVLLLVNREPPGMDVSIAASAVEEAIDVLVRGGDIPLPPEATVPAESDGLDRYAGRYRFADGSEAVVEVAPGALALEPRGPAPTRLLAFPAASASESEVVARLDRRADEIVDGIARGDYGPLGRALADSSRLPAYRDYLSGWWKGLEERGARRDQVEVVGTVPIWWAVGDDRLATVIVGRVGDRAEAFRLHWRDGRVVGLGGGAVREPATTLFAPREPGDFVGYHLGIRRPVRLSFDVGRSGDVAGLCLETRAGTLCGSRVEE